MKPGKDFVGVGVGAFIVKEGKLLLLKRKKPPEKGCWMVPGGKVEKGQTLENALKQEVKQELGVECEVLGLLCVVDHILPEEKTHFVAPTFMVKLHGKPSIQEKDKHSDLKWFSLDQLPAELAKVNKPAVKEYLGLLENREDFYERLRELIESEEKTSVEVRPGSDMDKILTWVEGFGFHPYEKRSREN
jgi:ADP-ribose pyrophosphatase YjhB (NUDIX family)